MKPCSTRLWLPQRSFLFLSLLLTRIALCLEILCSDDGTQAELADCQYILAHLPSIPVPPSQDPANDTTTRLLDPSIPFFPNAIFQRRSCVVEVVLEASATKFSPAHLTTLNGLEGWRLIKEGIRSILIECMDESFLGGIAFADVITSDLYVGVYASPARVKYWRRRQREAMSHDIRVGPHLDSSPFLPVFYKL